MLQQRVKSSFIRALFVVLILQLSAFSVLAGDGLRIGVFPRHNYAETIHMFLPVARYLSRNLGEEVKISSAKSFREFWSNVKKRKYDIIHLNQYQYLQANKKFGYNIILKNEEFGKSTLRSIIVVRKDSSIKNIADLKNKKIIFGGNKTAMMSYLIPSKMLAEANLTAGQYKKAFARNPPNALMAVVLKQADACGVGDAVLKLGKIQQRLDEDDIKIIATSAPVPHLAWAVASSMSDNKARAIQKILLELNKDEAGKKILERAKLTGIHIATHEEYSELLKYVR